MLKKKKKLTIVAFGLLGELGNVDEALTVLSHGRSLERDRETEIRVSFGENKKKKWCVFSL